MTSATGHEALRTARAEAAEWDDGERSVILTGSHARGDGHPEADLDLRIVGDGPSSKILKRREPFLISISAMSEKDNRKRFTEPGDCVELVPGWRSAIVLIDPTDVARKLKEEAERWTWDRVDGAEADEWVAEKITALAEEIHTLVGDLDQGLRPAAAATVAGIATALPPIMAVHRRLLYRSEKEIWSKVAEEMGGRWDQLQSSALGEGSFAEAIDAAFGLFLIAAGDTETLFHDHQRQVVDHARELASARAGGRS